MGALRTPSACKFLLISLVLVGLSSISITDAAKKFHIVGDSGFKYPEGAHNTVRVSESGYSSCEATEMESMNAMWTGNDMYSLGKGDNYFICGIPGHCGAGMKVKIFAK
ncbi:hypothetical protein C5167_015546 [Papaver somniferum]|uniref:Phytocyanin domain-containing protein n=1 Tax=Papaver somniferum TaxID=3469 RepID=A0A4Y7JAQ2_PAPSO|nr:hypothetical protein C5167_015546 [Papaver somniferum]